MQTNPLHLKQNMTEEKMQTEFEYIRFDKIDDTGKTTVWACVNKRFEFNLGTIRWYSGWRQYVFVPNPNTEFSAGCLLDVVTFIGQLMAIRRCES